MTGDRQAMLERIRSALSDVPESERPSDVAVERTYLTNDSAPSLELVERFIERLIDYKAAVRKTDAVGLPATIAASCAERGVKRLVVPADLPSAWIPEEVTTLFDPGLTNRELDESDGVLTACSVGIAQTGTIVLDSGPAQGRRAITLLPDYHLCVIRDDQIVGLVPEAIARLEPVAAHPGRPLTFISGPSATSDIELNRVEGVHGPRSLEVIVVVGEYSSDRSLAETRRDARRKSQFDVQGSLLSSS